MRRPILHWLLCICALALTLFGARLLQAGSPAGPVAIRAPTYAPGQESFDLHYEDLERRSHRFTCQIDASFARQEQDAFGYPLDGDQTLGELETRLKAEVKRLAGTVAPYLDLKIIRHSTPQSELGAPVAWSNTLKFRLGALPPQLRAQEPVVVAKIMKSLDEIEAKIYREYYEKRGFEKGIRATEEGQARYEIAYKSIADLARSQLTDCYDQLIHEAGGGLDDQEIVARLSALFQGMSHEPLPVQENGTYRAGFWTPTEVLEHGAGDCDSNSTTLCALWRRPHSGPNMILVVQGVQHALLGYEAKRLTGQKGVVAGNRHYVLYEAWRHPGSSLTATLQAGETLSSSPPVWGFCMTDDCCGDGQRECRVFEDPSGD
jgi:hypothetical protein